MKRRTLLGYQLVTGLSDTGTGLLLIVRRGRRPLPVRDPVEARDALLEELAELEDARAADQVGPLTYGTARRELIDRLALTLVHL